MASEAQSSEEKRPPPPRRWPRLLAWLAPLLILCLALWWALATESGARWVLARALQAAAPSVAIEGVHGRLLGPLHIDTLRQHSADGQQLQAQGVQLQWSPRALFSGLLQIESLELERLLISTSMQSDSTPPSLPPNLALPLRISLDRLLVKQTEIRRGPLPLAQLGALAARLDYDGQRYRLQLDPLQLSSADPQLALLGQLQGQATLADRQPYALQGELGLSSQARVGGEALDTRARASLSGTLAALDLGLDLELAQKAAPARLQGKLRLQPFAERVLGPSALNARQLDLSGLSAAAPSTRLDLALTVDEAGRGQLQLSNGAAGPWSEKQLPLSELHLAFAQQARSFLLRDIDARLGNGRRDGGRIRGQGELAGGALQLALQLSAVDVSALDARARRSALFGTLALQHSAGQDRLQIDLSERGTLPMSLQARASLSQAVLQVEQARLQAGGGELRASARIGLEGEQALQAQGSFARFSPRAFGNFAGLPDLLLNGDFTLGGKRAPQLAGQLRFQLKDSKLAGQSLQGQGQLSLAGQVLEVPRLTLQAGDNRVDVDGRLSPEKQSGQLRYALKLSKLEQLGLGLSGAFMAQGTLQGQARSPLLDGSFEAQQLLLPGTLRLQDARGTLQVAFDMRQPLALNALALDARLQQLGGAAPNQSMAAATLSLRFGPQANKPLVLRLQARELRDGERRLDQLDLNGSGSTGKHVLDLSARRGQQLLSLRASGGLSWKDQAPDWRGQLDALQSQGRLAAQLLGPAPLAISAQRQALQNLRLQTAAGQLEIESLVHDAARSASRGRLTRLQPAQLLALLPKAPPLSSDLVLDGEWDIELAQRLRGHASLSRVSGDVSVQGASPVTLGLSKLEAALKAEGNRIALTLDAAGARLGQIALAASAGMALEGKRVRIAGDAALSGTARADMPAIDWVAGMVSPSLITEGRLQSEVRLGGTLDHPSLSGQISGERLRVFLTDLGLDLRQGRLAGNFTEDRFVLESLRFGGEDGQLELSGPIRLSGARPSGELKLQARRYALFHRSDRRIVVSGDSGIALASPGLRVRGRFNIDQGFIDIGRSELPQLSDDVVIVGREKKEGAALAADIEVTVSLGDQLRLQGRGLKARLAGELKIENRPGQPLQSQGIVRVAEGTFTAYGRDLTIEQGALRFTGAINNPALDIRAMRRSPEVSAGVSLQGTVLSPRVTLVSDPVVPDAEKLSWLVLGHGLSGSGGADAASLQAAAGSLLSGSAAAGAQSQLASHFGLDSFGVSRTNDNLQQRVVTLGRQVSDRLFVSVAQNLETSNPALRIRYMLSPRLTAEVEAGVSSFLSLFYNLAFD